MINPYDFQIEDIWNSEYQIKLAKYTDATEAAIFFQTHKELNIILDETGNYAIAVRGNWNTIYDWLKSQPVLLEKILRRYETTRRS